MRSSDPIHDAIERELEWDEYCKVRDATQPKCAECGDVLSGTVYDFTGVMEEGYVFCETCVNNYFNENSGELNEALRAATFDNFRRRL